MKPAGEPFSERWPRHLAWLGALGLVLSSAIYPSLPTLSKLSRSSEEGQTLRRVLDPLHAPYEIDPKPASIAPPTPTATPIQRRPPATPRALAAFRPELFQGKALPKPRVSPTTPKRASRREVALRVVGVLRAGPGKPLQAVIEDGAGRSHFVEAGAKVAGVLVVKVDVAGVSLRGPDGRLERLRPGSSATFELPERRQ